MEGESINGDILSERVFDSIINTYRPAPYISHINRVPINSKWIRYDDDYGYSMARDARSSTGGLQYKDMDDEYRVRRYNVFVRGTNDYARHLALWASLTCLEATIPESLYGLTMTSDTEYMFDDRFWQRQEDQSVRYSARVGDNARVHYEVAYGAAMHTAADSIRYGIHQLIYRAILQEFGITEETLRLERLELENSRIYKNFFYRDVEIPVLKVLSDGRVMSYDTCIYEVHAELARSIGNATKYSATTSKHQKQHNVEGCAIVLRDVPAGTQSLVQYFNQYKRLFRS